MAKWLATCDIWGAWHNCRVEEIWDDVSALMPDSVRKVLLPWERSREQLWALTLATSRVPLENLTHLLDVPMWRGEDGRPFTTRPSDVLAVPKRYPCQFGRVIEADLTFPVHITRWMGNWIVLDGVHRVAKAVLLGWQEIDAHKVQGALHPAFALTPQLASPARG